jgi:hypothetical protein
VARSAAAEQKKTACVCHRQDAPLATAAGERPVCSVAGAFGATCLSCLSAVPLSCVRSVVGCVSSRRCTSFVFSFVRRVVCACSPAPETAASHTADTGRRPVQGRAFRTAKSKTKAQGRTGFTGGERRGAEGEEAAKESREEEAHTYCRSLAASLPPVVPRVPLPSLRLTWAEHRRVLLCCAAGA